MVSARRIQPKAKNLESMICPESFQEHDGFGMVIMLQIAH